MTTHPKSKVLIMLMNLSLSACAFPLIQDPRSIVGVDPVFTSYVESFESNGISIGGVSIGFGPTASNIAGVCTRWNNGFREIAINQNYWSTASEDARWGLIFHELGHCVLNREHVSTKHAYKNLSVPDSLMYPYNFFSSSYSELRYYYNYELFNSTPPPSTNSTQTKVEFIDEVANESDQFGL